MASPEPPRPCPCCGSSKIYAGRGPNTSGEISCEDCGLGVVRRIDNSYLKGDETVESRIREALTEALKVWNRRTP